MALHEAQLAESASAWINNDFKSRLVSFTLNLSKLNGEQMTHT